MVAFPYTRDWKTWEKSFKAWKEDFPSVHREDSDERGDSFAALELRRRRLHSQIVQFSMHHTIGNLTFAATFYNSFHFMAWFLDNFSRTIRWFFGHLGHCELHTGAKILNYSKYSHFEISLFTKFTFSKSHFWQKSQFQILIFDKIHIFKISFYPKSTFFKHQILGNFQIESWFLSQCVELEKLFW